jgi:hypothetical protein
LRQRLLVGRAGTAEQEQVVGHLGGAVATLAASAGALGMA